MGLLAALLILTVLISAGMGFIRIPVGEVARIVLARLAGQEAWLAELDPLHPTVVLDVRLPRILTAAAVGGGLALAGCAFQGILLNPLADPYTLGVSAGAAFGAAIALLLNIQAAGGVSIPLFAFAGAGLTLLTVIFLSTGAGGVSSSNLILSGIIVAAILSAGISFLKYLAEEQVAAIVFWLMGSFGSRTWADAGTTFVAAGIGLSVFLFFGRDLNLLALGERSAASLGVDTRRVTLAVLVAASLVTAICVSVSGIIGFVGLLVPHLTRSLVGPDNRRLLPAAFLAGATLLLWADTIVRAVLPAEVPVGVLTALIGGPFFCYVFRRRQMARTLPGA
jgi:iron complex transport system permease protein